MRLATPQLCYYAVVASFVEECHELADDVAAAGDPQTPLIAL